MKPRTLATVIALAACPAPAFTDSPAFEAGAAREDITPPAGLPMWGYGARKDMPAVGTLDPLTATAVVIQVGGERLAIVGLDLGRSPARESLRLIREEVEKEAQVRHLFLVGSHTHHGPCIELEKTPPIADYVRDLRGKIVSAVVRAAKVLRPARIGGRGEDVEWNRNRHSKLQPKPVDRRLTVVRLDDLEGKPIAVLVNFAAHPTTRQAIVLKWSADFPGPLRTVVEEGLGGTCVFLQGACGDLSADKHGLDTEAYGAAVGKEAVRIAKLIETRTPAKPAIASRVEEFKFSSRIQLADPLTYAKYCLAFFQDLVDAYVEEYKDGVRPNLTVTLLNGDLGIVGASGEFFASHALRLRERARLETVLFLGYTNGYHQYFPTIEGAAEGGYGADPEVAPVEVGAGERMMDRALMHLYDLRRLKP